ncbi:MAG: hypothetical protein FWD75_03290 [Propionibacteriaceae bacterium]|nr:hypothetical protein [Propionibacteriaceae bacterium]
MAKIIVADVTSPVFSGAKTVRIASVPLSVFKHGVFRGWEYCADDRELRWVGDPERVWARAVVRDSKPGELFFTVPDPEGDWDNGPDGSIRLVVCEPEKLARVACVDPLVPGDYLSDIPDDVLSDVAVWSWLIRQNLVDMSDVPVDLRVGVGLMAAYGEQSMRDRASWSALVEGE